MKGVKHSRRPVALDRVNGPQSGGQAEALGFPQPYSDTVSVGVPRSSTDKDKGQWYRYTWELNSHKRPTQNLSVSPDFPKFAKRQWRFPAI
jgi:hypothetical protein